MDNYITREQLSYAIKNNEFTTVYQPKVGKNWELIGYESLTRWKHYSPKDFFGAALVYKQFLPLAILIARLIAQDINRYKLRDVSVNISPIELANLTHLLELTEVLMPHKRNISFEVTEDTILDKKAIQSIEFLSRDGFKIGIDDFGIGYSRLSSIPKLPIDYIKFDISLCNKCLDVDYARFLSHWCDYFTFKFQHSLTKQIGIPVLAEGVEGVNEYQQLKRLGFTEFQGFLFSRPLPPAEVLKKGLTFYR